MKANKNWINLVIVVVVTTIVGFSAGYFLVDLSHSQAAASLMSEPTNRSALTQPDRMSALDRSGRSDALVDVSDLEDLTRFQSHFERTVALNELLQGVTMDSLQAILEQSKSISSTNLRDSAQQAIFQRLATLNPKAALEQIGEVPIENRQLLLQTVFEEWSLTNLDQAIKEAQSLDSVGKLSALEGILVSTEHRTHEERRAIARRLGNEWLAVEEIKKGIDAELFEDPEREWSVFVSNNENMQRLNHAQTKMLVYIASAWIARDGVGVFDRIRESFPSQYPLLETISSVVNELFQRNPRVALEMAANVKGIGSMQREKLAEEVLTRWAESAPQDALEAANRIKRRYLRRQLQAVVLETWATTDAHALLGFVGSLPADLQDVAREQALVAMARTAPTHAMETLNDIADRHIRNEVAKTIAVHWARQDVMGALNWIGGNEQLSSMQDHLMKTVFEELARTDPRLAFETALTYPPGVDGKGMEAHVITTLAYGGDLDRAVSLLPETREGKTRDHALENIIHCLLLEEDSMRASDAMDLFVQATKTNSVGNMETMLMYLAWKAPLVLFNSLDELPSQKLRLKAARSLVTHNEDNRVFTEDEWAEIQERGQRTTESSSN